MTVFGKIIVPVAHRRMEKDGIVKMSVLEYIAGILPIGPKTVQSRLTIGGWLFDELKALQGHFDSDEIQAYIDQEFLKARQS